MSSAPQPPPTPESKSLDGILDVQGDGYSEKLVDAIEMLGEEKAAGLRPAPQSEVTPGMRYLHCSRTIHQLVTDRNRAVGIFLAVASLLLTASSVLSHADPKADLIIPPEELQRWSLPITFATLTVLAVFVALLLIRTRAGLIYEVAKMNALLGLPIGRVQRISPLSIFFLMQLLISLLGGACAALFSVFMVRLTDPQANAFWPAFLIGVTVAALLVALYVVTVSYITSEHRLAQLDLKPPDVTADATGKK